MPVRNPVDFYPAMERNWQGTPLKDAANILLKDPNVDVILMHIVSGLGGEELDLQQLKSAAKKAGKEILFWVIGRRKSTREFRIRARQLNFQVFDEISRAMECLDASRKFTVSGKSKISKNSASTMIKIKEVSADKSGPSGGVLDEFDSKKILTQAGIPTVNERIAASLSDAKAFARELGFPVVVKGLMPGEIHKTELGLVKTGIEDFKSLVGTVQAIKKKMNGNGRILVQQQIDTDYELIVGFLRDNQFGPCIMFGLGGIFSELDPDVRFALAPFAKKQAVNLIKSIRNRRLLSGFRGMAALDLDTMAELLVNLGRLGVENPNIEQIDINPVAIHIGRPVAVDATLIFHSETATKPV